MGEGDEPAARCRHQSCPGSPLHDGWCLEHLDAARVPLLAADVRAGERLDASNTTIGADRLQQLLRLLEDDDGLPLLPEANFRGATFAGDANFRSATFGGAVVFDGARFTGRAGFGGVRFRGRADFAAAVFERNASFVGALFDDAAMLHGARFVGDGAFAQVAVEGDAYFMDTTFGGEANFRETRIEGSLHFGHATIDADAAFQHMRFGGDADFRGLTFRRARRLGPLAVAGALVLDDCLFAERVSIEAEAGTVSARGTTFAGGAQLRFCRAELAFEDANFAHASTLFGATTMRVTLPGTAVGDGGPYPRPRLITLRGARVAALTLSDVELDSCMFFGAQGLESLNIGANCSWLREPSRRGSREMLAEEHLWRTNDELSDLRPQQIAALYRALRKAREDGKDEAGASDLYVGEMEMRRHGAAKRSDRVILWLYYLTSGYGLRAGNALFTLLLAVLAASLGLWAWGFHDDPSYTRALFVAIESTSSLLRTPDSHGLVATYAGEVIQIVLRLLGPLLIGLALLAVRARVKR